MVLVKRLLYQWEIFFAQFFLQSQQMCINPWLVLENICIQMNFNPTGYPTWKL